VTLALPKPWAGAALWTKQDFEESLGKSEEIGLKIVIQEKIKTSQLSSAKGCVAGSRISVRADSGRGQ